MAETLSMGNCKGCGAPWSLSKYEHNFYTRKMEEIPGFNMPTHCRPCRDKKRTKEEKVSAISIYNRLMIHLNKMVAESEKGNYTLFNEKILTRDLQRAATQLRRFAEQIRIEENANHHQPTQS